MGKKTGGRPSKLTKKTQEKFIKQIKKGAYYEIAAANCGITERTLYKWLQKGKEAQRRDKYYKFYHAVKEAESQLETELGERLFKDGGYKGIIAFMERRWRKRWSKTENRNVEHSGEIKQEVSGKVEVSIHDRIKERAEYYQSIKPGTDGND
jgi:hypothetical protein